MCKCMLQLVFRKIKVFAYVIGKHKNVTMSIKVNEFQYEAAKQGIELL